MSNNIVNFYHYKPFKTDLHFDELLKLKNYLKQKIWFTRLQDFNDPFEGSFILRHEIEDVLNDTQSFQSYFNSFKNNGYLDLSENEFIKMLKNKQFIEAQKNIESEIITSFFNKHGAICLASENDNILMWSHYADNQKGYCLIFEIDFNLIYEIAFKSSNFTLSDFNAYKDNVINGKELLSFNVKNNIEFVFTKTRYEKIPPTVDLNALKNKKAESEYSQIEYLIQNSASVKYKKWEYENEFRLITNSNSQECGLFDLNAIPFLKITGVILGSNIDTNIQEEIVNFCKELKTIKIHKASCSQSEYKIEINEYIH